MLNNGAGKEEFSGTIDELSSKSTSFPILARRCNEQLMSHVLERFAADAWPLLNLCNDHVVHVVLGANRHHVRRVRHREQFVLQVLEKELRPEGCHELLEC